MKRFLRNLLSCSGTIDRLPYLAIGVGLLAIKFLVDAAVSRFIFQRSWSPIEYLRPDSSLTFLFGGMAEREFCLTLLSIALPFIFMGISLSAMRLRSVGLSAGWTFLFFVPAINFVFFAILVVLPRRRDVPVAAVMDDPGIARIDSPVRRDVDVPLLTYGRDTGEPWFNEILPANPAAARAIAIFAPVPIAFASTFISIQCFSNYGWGVFVGVPFAIGLMSSVLYAARTPRGVRGCIGVACLSLTVYGLALLLVAFEGAGCLIMAAPLAYPLAVLGATVGASLARIRRTGLGDARSIVLLMLIFLPAFTGAEKMAQPEAPVFAVTSSVEIDASPDRVWANVIGFREISPPSEWIFRTGVAYPIRAHIVGSGVGAMRYCVFSTGPFIEPIRVWDEPRLLKFDVASNPPPMKEWSPWSDVHPPHLENFLVSKGGQFRLIQLPGGRTRLEGTTWYQHHMWPAPYWRLWSDFIIHRIHLRVLNQVKRLSESSAAA